MVEGTISAWTVPEGATVKKGDTIMEFENEKNTIEFASTHDGILHITAQEGDVVAVGAPIGCVAESQEEYAALCGGQSAPAAAPEPVAAAPAEAAPAAAGWTCACGQAGNTGKFCANCGKPAPAPANEWTCECGAKNTGKFCSNCGKPFGG